MLKDVTTVEHEALTAMRDAGCVLKDLRRDCSHKGWKKHCRMRPYLSWMMKHCSFSCGFDCKELVLEREIQEKKEAKAREEEAKEGRKSHCPELAMTMNSTAVKAHQYAQKALGNAIPCRVRQDEAACSARGQYLRLSHVQDMKHKATLKAMIALGCFQSHPRTQNIAEYLRSAMRRGQNATQGHSRKLAGRAFVRHL